MPLGFAGVELGGMEVGCACAVLRLQVPLRWKRAATIG